MKKKAPPPSAFGIWLRKQVHRTDDVGKVARMVVADEDDLGVRLRCVEDRASFSFYIGRVAKAIGVSEGAGRDAWREWAASLQEVR